VDGREAPAVPIEEEAGDRQVRERAREPVGRHGLVTEEEDDVPGRMAGEPPGEEIGSVEAETPARSGSGEELGEAGEGALDRLDGTRQPRT
jgi:hypothetical protein